MSYTPPNYDEVTASWEGDEEYTPPDYDAVTASWEEIAAGRVHSVVVVVT